ncbi:MAG TPA: ectoine utilization protein EutA [Thermohalobaculum sp.]|nr:ectoine utilization protein EutA [Thermohalobaculum sp.]
MGAVESPVPEVVESDAEPGLEPETAVARLGLIALSTDLTLERDALRLIPPDRAALHTTRVDYANPTTPANLAAMAPRIGAAAARIVPGVDLAAICFGCTSASVVIGEAAVDRAVAEGRPGVPVVTPPRAARWAFAALGVRRIALLTPYLAETTRPMARYFEEHGLGLASIRCLGMADDRLMARLSRGTLVAEAEEADAAGAEALFISCTAVPALGVVAELEKRLGKPVVCSNQACLWSMLHLAGLGAEAAGPGALFARALPADRPAA